MLIKKLNGKCTCPPDLPYCICGSQSFGKNITKKPIICTKLDTIVDKDWFNDCTNVSTSLVNLERISP